MDNGNAERMAETAADLAAMDEPLVDVQEKFASLQRFEVSSLVPSWHAASPCLLVHWRWQWNLSVNGPRHVWQPSIC